MRNPDIDLLETDLDDGLAVPDPLELGFAVDLVHDDYDDEQDGDLGLRALFENPEMLLRSLRTPRAA